MKRRLRKGKKEPIVIVALISFVVILGMTIGFSAFSDAGLISNIGATIKSQKDIRITGVVATNPVSGAISNYVEYSADSISSSLQLPNANSKMTYEVDVTNFGNVEMVLKSLYGLPSNLKYTVNNYTMNSMICDDIDNTKCTLGAKKMISITIGYVNSSSYDSSSTTYPFVLEFEFVPFNRVAQVGSNYFQSLGEAINSVSTSNPTTVILLQDTSEAVIIPSGKNIILDLQNNTLSNDGNTNVIRNYGTLSLSNGTISSDAATNGAVNNEPNATMSITGGRFIMTGGRQALYNDRATITISGDPYFYSSATERAAVQNTNGGTMTFASGTVVSTGYSALYNAGTLTVGAQGAPVSKTSPLFKGAINGINSGKAYTMYDGILKGISNAASDDTKITVGETGYLKGKTNEVIDGTTYKTLYLAAAKTITFDPNGGNVTPRTMTVAEGSKPDSLPTPTRNNYTFEGWFTQASGGTEITTNTVIDDDITVVAHWSLSTGVARVNGTLYDTVQAAINAAPNGTQTTVEILKNVSENVTVSSTKNIAFDIGNNIWRNSAVAPIITNDGIVSISNGTITSTAAQGTINNDVGATLTISGGEIRGTVRQAVYIYGGTVTISGDAYLVSACTGKPTGATMERGTVHNVAGTLYITGGTIVGTNQQAVSNDTGATTIIGTQGGSVSTTSPVLQGAINGIKTVGTFNFYDGIIKGGTHAINGTVSAKESGYSVTTGSETIDGTPYETAKLTAD